MYLICRLLLRADSSLSVQWPFLRANYCNSLAKPHFLADSSWLVDTLFYHFFWLSVQLDIRLQRCNRFTCSTYTAGRNNWNLMQPDAFHIAFGTLCKDNGSFLTPNRETLFPFLQELSLWALGPCLVSWLWLISFGEHNIIYLCI